MPPWMYSELKPCGTSAAYDRHIKHGEPACRPCREANARRWREQNKLKPRQSRKPRPAAPEAATWQPGLLVDVLGLLDVCEAADPYESYADRREAILEGGAA